jgi:hypothetical protein
VIRSESFECFPGNDLSGLDCIFCGGKVVELWSYVSVLKCCVPLARRHRNQISSSLALWAFHYTEWWNIVDKEEKDGKAKPKTIKAVRNFLISQGESIIPWVP